MNRLKRIKKAIGNDGLLIAVVVFLVGLSWSWLFTSRVTELANSTVVGYFFALVAFLVIVGLNSYVFTKTIFWINKKLLAKKSSHWLALLIFIIWAGVEYTASLLSALIWIGRGGSVDSVLPFASFTPYVAYTPLRFLARMVGFHGLSAVVVVLIYVFSVKKLRKFALATTGFVFTATVFSWALYKSPAGPNITATIVSEKLSAPTNELLSGVDLVVIPEYGLSSAGSGKNRLSSKPDADTFYVGSKQVPGARGHKNVLVFGSTKSGDIEQRDKSRLIPGGEYLPYFAEGILNITKANKTKDYFDIFKAVEKGPRNYSTLNADGKYYLGSAVCSSIISPEDYRRFTANGATVLTNSASLGIFNSKLFTFQHQGLAKFMAAANARPFLQSSNDADAFAINHNGNMLVKISPTNFEEINIDTNNKMTPYSLLGEWPAYIGLIATTVLLVKKLKLRIGHK